MEVQFEPALQAKLEQIARESGRAAADLVQDAVAGYVDELAETRQMLNSRYDDIKGGKVKLIPAMRYSQGYAQRARPAGHRASAWMVMISTRKGKSISTRFGIS